MQLAKAAVQEGSAAITAAVLERLPRLAAEAAEEGDERLLEVLQQERISGEGLFHMNFSSARDGACVRRGCLLPCWLQRVHVVVTSEFPPPHECTVCECPFSLKLYYRT